MTELEIKEEFQAASKQIREGEIRIAKIRAICKHEFTFRGVYSWRVGAYADAEICSDCGELISYYK